MSATFFQLGTMLNSFPHGRKLTKQIVQGGHALANHSWDHPNMSGNDYQQLSRTNDLIVKDGAPKPCLFRAPYGNSPKSVIMLASYDAK